MARGTRRHRLRPRKQWIEIQKFKETARLDGRLPPHTKDKGKAKRQGTGAARPGRSAGRNNTPRLTEPPDTVTARRKKPSPPRPKKTRLDSRQFERLVRTDPVKARKLALMVGRTTASTEQKPKWKARSAHDRAIAEDYLSGEISYAVALKRMKRR